jgi:hypothetical protein
LSGNFFSVSIRASRRAHWVSVPPESRVWKQIGAFKRSTSSDLLPRAGATGSPVPLLINAPKVGGVSARRESPKSVAAKGP